MRTTVLFITIGMLATMTTRTYSNDGEAYKNPKLGIDRRVDDLLQRMTLDEKIDLLDGRAGDSTRENTRLGIPPLRVTDGPHGVGWGVKATCFPTAISMAASWNPSLVEQIAAAMGDEARAENRQVLLGPCINIHRTPVGGRNFESYSEDPYLASRLAVAYVKGLQSRKVGASVKHYACNNQEWERTTISAEVDERTLNEIYLPAFKAAVQEADPWTVMAAYNRVNGPYCCANRMLLTDLLKNEFGFKGLVVSDWGAVHGTVDSANAGLDLEMPGPGKYFGAALREAVKAGDVTEATIDDKARRVLRVLFLAGLFDPPDVSLKGSIDTPEHRELSRRMAEDAIVLLKNEGGLLPLNADKIQSIAVIGPNAAEARVGGGGSSTVHPSFSVSPLEGLQRKCGDRIKVQYAEGCPLPVLTPVAGTYLSPTNAAADQHGLLAEYFDNIDLQGMPVLTRIDADVNFDWGHKAPAEGLKENLFSVRWTGKLTPKVTGSYQFGVESDDGCRLYLDNELLIDSWMDQVARPTTRTLQLEGGKDYLVRLEYYENQGGAMAKLLWSPPSDSIEKAAALARESDVAIVCAGLSADFEGEGYDRPNIELPGQQNELIKAVVAANKNTIVVLNNGTPLNMTRWIDQVPALIEAWYPGNEGGTALAKILFGDISPSGKLPDTFPKKIEDVAAQANYPGKGGKVVYAEGLLVGYRYFDAKNVEPLFPFGYGLSYTTFEYSDLKIESRIDGGLKISVSVNVKNTGPRAGAEIVQLYVHDVQSSVERPPQELKAFSKVSLKPGEEKTVTMELNERSLAFYDVGRHRWIAEPGEFELRVGASSRDIRLKGTYVFKGE